MNYQQTYGTAGWARQESGGLGFAALADLWQLVRVLNPSCIGESGTFRGVSARIMAEACPSAKVHTFDIAPRDVAYPIGEAPANLSFYRGDITNAPFPFDLVFIDDHCGQLDRLKWAKAHGINHVIMDDCALPDELGDYGQPASPTIHMFDVAAEGYEIVNEYGAYAGHRNTRLTYLRALA